MGIQKLARHAWMLLLIFNVGSECGYYDPSLDVGDSVVDDRSHEISVLAHATAPQGTWTVVLQGEPELTILSSKAISQGTISRTSCIGYNCQKALELSCPQGMCSFEFALNAHGDHPNFDTASVGAYFRLEAEGGGGGCEDRNPNYVEEDERERFFKLTLEVLKLRRCEEDYRTEPDGNSPSSFEPLDAGVVEVVDCDGYPQADEDASSYGFEPEVVDAGDDGGIDAGGDAGEQDLDAGDGGG